MSIIRPYPKRARSYGPWPTAPLGVVWHMAEGGNTAAYLTSAPVIEAGNSSHVVIERDGDVIGVLPLGLVAGSINPRLIRQTDDPAFVGYNGERIVFGATAARAVLGSHRTNPNPVLIAVEIEGFARRGPNAAQRVACVLLSRELRARYPSLRGNLGHRDLQSYKACPGRFLPFANMGGHGRYRA